MILRIMLCFCCLFSVCAAEEGIYNPPYAIAVHSVPAEKLTFNQPYRIMGNNGRPQNTPPEYLMQNYAYTAQQLAGLNYDQLNRIHGWEVTHQRQRASVSAAINQVNSYDSSPQYQWQIQCNGKSCRKVLVRVR